MIRSNAARRHRFLFSGAIAAFTAAFAMPVLAQSSQPAAITASATRAITTDQTQSLSAITRSANDPFVDVNGNASTATIDVSGNSASASARANQAVASLAPTALDLGATYMGTSITTGATGTTAYSPALIATRQTADQSTVTGTVGGTITGARIGAVLGDVSSSSAKVTGNTEEAIALANDASATLALSGGTLTGGAGLVSDQAVTGNSSITAAQNGTIRLKANSATGSDLAMTGNLERAIAYGSSATNALTADATSINGPSSLDFPSTVQPNAADPSVHADFAVVSDQRMAGSVNAADNGWFNMRVFGPVSGSNLAVSSNSLVAAGYGNQSANSLTLTSPSITSTGYMSGAIADVTNVQQVAGSVSASGAFGSRLLIDGDTTGSTAALKNNSVVALATGNQADGNQLTVSGSAISAGPDGFNGGLPPIINIVGTAVADANGAMSVSAPFSVQNDQANQGAITATIAPAMMPLAVAGKVTGSSLVASGNSSAAAATGNSGANGLSLTGTSIATAADVNSLQISQGTVLATIGSGAAPAGVTITAAGGADASSLAVTGNSLSDSATGNTVNNALAVTGVSLANVSGHSDAEAGAMPAGYGAAADFALANAQSLHGGYQMPAQVTSVVYGSFGVAAGGAVTGSSVTVSDNSQSSSALGNGATNTLTLTADSLVGSNARAPGSALSSIQSGQTDIKAVSDMALVAPAVGAGSSLAVSGNTNAATARMNVATNTLNVDTGSASLLSGGAVAQSGLGAIGEVSGDHVLANTQLALGSVTADAQTAMSAVGVGPLNGASASISGNQTQALATANSAVNSLTLTSASGANVAVGLGNVQSNYAGVTATASTALTSGGGSALNGQGSFAGNVTAAEAQGNTASNTLALTGSAAGAVNAASIAAGPLNAVAAPAVLSNVQANAGAVMATSSSPNALIAGAGLLNGSSLAITGNAVTAAAYGNNATNTVTLASSGALPAAAIANTQVNSGPVAAQVVSASYAVSPATSSGSRLTLTGNTSTAQAIGNYAASAITH